MTILMIPTAIISIIIALVILKWPKSLNYAIAVWLLINGILQLLAYYGVI